MSSDNYVYQQCMQQSDSGELFVCPYDPVHRIAAKRFVRHILKCRKNHPNSNMTSCPFNARHIVPKPELQMHISTCPDKRLLEHELNCERINFQNNELRGDLSVPPHTTQEDLDFGNDEDWDAEIQQVEQHAMQQRLLDERNRHLEATKSIAKQHAKQRPNSIGIGRGSNLIKSVKQEKEERKPTAVSTKPVIQLAANFNRKPIVRSQTQTGGYNRGRPVMNGVASRLATNNRPDLVSAEIDAEIEKSLQTMIDKSKSNEANVGTSSESSSDLDPVLTLHREKKKLVKLLKQISHLDLKAASGAQLNSDEKNKIKRKAFSQTRLFEINLELGEN